MWMTLLLSLIHYTAYRDLSINKWADEPTSGLDAFQAMSVMSAMKDLAGKRE